MKNLKDHRAAIKINKTTEKENRQTMKLKMGENREEDYTD